MYAPSRGDTFVLGHSASAHFGDFASFSSSDSVTWIRFEKSDLQIDAFVVDVKTVVAFVCETICASRWGGWDGSSGTQVAPALLMANIDITNQAVFSKHTCTR